MALLRSWTLCLLVSTMTGCTSSPPRDEMDAIAPDAGEIDAGEIDAGPSDAGSADDVFVPHDVGAPIDGGLAATVDDFRIDLAETWCAADARCGTFTVRNVIRTLPTDCVADLVAAHVGLDPTDATTYDPTAAAACLAWFDDASCLDLVAAFDVDYWPTACSGIVLGDAPPGAPCRQGGSGCSDARSLCTSGGSCHGTCSEPVASGGDCYLSASCAPGERCLDRACTPLASADAPCLSSVACEPGLHCAFHSDDPSEAGSCVAGELALGDRCEPYLGCGSTALVCVATREGPAGPVFTCEPPRTDGTCRAGPAVASSAAGDCGTGACTASELTPPYEGACSSAPTIGEGCGAFQSPCRDGGLCSMPRGAGTCVRARDLGEPCSSAEECRTYWCVSGHCVEPSIDLVCPV